MGPERFRGYCVSKPWPSSGSFLEKNPTCTGLETATTTAEPLKAHSMRLRRTILEDRPSSAASHSTFVRRFRKHAPRLLRAKTKLPHRGFFAEGHGADFLKRYRVKGIRNHPVRISFNEIEAYDQRNDMGRGNEKRKVD
jgi:hypothetical protein